MFDKFQKAFNVLAYIVVFGIPVIALIGLATGHGKTNPEAEREIKRRENYKREKQKQEYEAQFQKLNNINVNIDIPQTYNTRHIYYYQNDYEELWDECEYLAEILEEEDIDHEEMYSSMDYDELEDLKSEYEDLLEENDISY